MHPNALLELATDLLHKVLQFDTPADRIVSDFFRTHRELGQRERHTLAETTYTVLRQRLLFQHLAQSGKGEMERRLVLLGWQGNEGFLRAALTEPEQQWLAQVQSVDRHSRTMRSNLRPTCCVTSPARSASRATEGRSGTCGRRNAERGSPRIRCHQMCTTTPWSRFRSPSAFPRC